jgi:hypothetical protein
MRHLVRASRPAELNVSIGFTDTRRVASCTKVRYVDLGSARRALAIVRKKAKPGAKVPCGVHPCAVCKGWRLTSKRSGGTPGMGAAWTRGVVQGQWQRTLAGLTVLPRCGHGGDEPRRWTD